jgi:hypothetical protein
MRLMTTACFVLLSLLQSGCSGGSEAEKLIKDSMAIMEQMATAIENNDEAAFNKLVPELKAIGERSKTVAKLSAEEEKSLKEKYEPEMTKIMGRMMSAGMKNPQMMLKLKDLGPALGKP